MTAAPVVTDLTIDKIRLEERYRRDLGDMAGLAESINAEGLMHPVVVTSDLRLIAGQRRLEACKSLGWTDVPVRLVEGTVDAASLLRMERDENTCRKDMTPSECVALGRALEELERPKGKEAMSEGGRLGAAKTNEPGFVPPNEPRRNRFDTREVVAPAVGMSTATYSRAKQLIDAAQNGDGEAMAQVIEMDRTGKVTKPYETWKGRRVKERNPGKRLGRNDREQRAELIAEMAGKGYTSRQMASKAGVRDERVRQIARDFNIEIPADRVVLGTRRINWTDALRNTVVAVENSAEFLEAQIDLAEVDFTEADEWLSSLTTSIRALNRFKQQIKEHSHV